MTGLGRRAAVSNWLRSNLFSSMANTVLTVLSVAALIALARPLLQWSVLAAHWGGADRSGCTCHCWSMATTPRRSGGG